MAILDKLTEFADATSVGTPNNTTVNVGSQIDLSLIGRELGNGQPLYVIISIDTAITSGGAATPKFLVSSDSTAAIAVDGTQTTHVQTDAVAIANYAAGKRWVLPLPTSDAALHTYERFLGVQVQETAGQALTGGTISAYLSLDPQLWKAYSDAAN